MPSDRGAERTHGYGGLPTGIQIVGRTYDDLSVFQAAAAYEAANPWRDVLPPLRSAEHARTAKLETGIEP